MPAYIIVRIGADDPDSLKAYQAAAVQVINQYGGKFIARGGSVVTLEGPHESRRIVIIEFPTLAQAQAYYHSPEYTEARKLRNGIAAELIAVDGIA